MRRIGDLNCASLLRFHSSPRGYEPKYRILESAIKKLAPTATVTGRAGRVSSFEVEVNGVLVHSKLSLGVFPDFAKLAAQIAQ